MLAQSKLKTKLKAPNIGTHMITIRSHLLMLPKVESGTVSEVHRSAQPMVQLKRAMFTNSLSIKHTVHNKTTQ